MAYGESSMGLYITDVAYLFVTPGSVYHTWDLSPSVAIDTVKSPTLTVMLAAQLAALSARVGTPLSEIIGRRLNVGAQPRLRGERMRPAPSSS